MTRRYMLDTNTVSHLIRGQPGVARRIQALPMAALCISSITHGELRFGVARRPEAKRLAALVQEFLIRVDAVAWDSVAAECYGQLRSEMERGGRVLSPLDMLIAAHALSMDAVMVTSDRAFAQVPALVVQDWTE